MTDPRRPAPGRDAPSAAPRLVVGALIPDPEGRVFVQRRSTDRRLFPGCWDVVGGAVEPGERAVDALAREIDEETGWTLRRVLVPLAHTEWRAQGRRHEERDYLVEVDGDLTAPRLELSKHPEFAWLGAGDLDLLDENRRRGAGDFVRDLVTAAHRCLAGPPVPGYAPEHVPGPWLPG